MLIFLMLCVFSICWFMFLNWLQISVMFGFLVKVCVWVCVKGLLCGDRQIIGSVVFVLCSVVDMILGWIIMFVLSFVGVLLILWCLLMLKGCRLVVCRFYSFLVSVCFVSDRFRMFGNVLGNSVRICVVYVLWICGLVIRLCGCRLVWIDKWLCDLLGGWVIFVFLVGFWQL